jgi:hypothetical protein
MITEIELSESGVHHTSHPLLWCFRFLFVGQMKSEVYKINVDTQNKLFSSILDAVASIKQRADLLKQHVNFVHKLQIALKLMIRF